MIPSVFRYNQYKFLFFSREERRMHVHVWSPDGEAKIWLEPDIEVAVNKGLKQGEVNELLKITKERIHEIKESWRKHFSR